MSEPVSNVEIEDVLSSIRRLVSEDVAQKDVTAPENAAPDTPEAEPVKEQTMKLVLTPYFRVNAGDDAADAGAPYAPVDDTPPTSRSEDLEAKIAELEVVIGEQGLRWEPDGSGFREDADAEETLTGNIREWVDHEDTATPEEAPVVEPLEAEGLKVVSEPEPVDEALVFEMEDETREAGAEAFVYDDEAVIDEETLRDMVAEIVREELQGALGERITRNVRKLVRREIGRVLASREFE
jgi:cell pole-organizing protein PopZ